MSMDKAIDAANTFGAKIQEVLTIYGPKATELALAVGRVESARQLLAAVGGLVISGCAAWGAKKFYEKWNTYVPKYCGDDSFLTFAIPCVLLSVVSSIVGIIHIFKILNPYAWVGLFHPEVALAAKALGYI